MIYTGKALRVDKLPSGIARLVFDLEGSSVNKFSQQTLEELRDAVSVLATTQIKGVIMFWLQQANAIFNAIEDLPVPTVTAINGIALGGGFEMAIATDYRVATADAVVGFPEVKLGILPGFGGTVRLPRLIGADNANQWISSGSHIKAQQAFEEGAVDAIVSVDKLEAAAEKLIEQCNDGKLDYISVRKRKTSALLLAPIELNVAYETAKGLVAAKAGPHYPAPVTAIKVMQDAAMLERAGALELEHKGFVKLAGTEVAANLVQMFLNEQLLGAKAKHMIAAAHPVNSAAVLGAGIMGGGIAYQSALRGTPIMMKDVVQEGIDLGMAEARKQLDKQVARGRLSVDKMVSILSNIKPTIDYSGIDKVDIVVEAVVENRDIKKKVLSELESLLGADTIITSNTSTISINDLASALKRPENFCGMHFFNPVPVMPLVEVIRGEHSSDTTIATTVAYAKKMGKTPIVVNDCPGFLVNRILFPYFGAFSQLIHDGADFRQIDKAMEQFGWPMGPAYLLDVVGVDTAVHAQAVMAEGFERMALDFDSAIDKLYAGKDLGQKSGKGFYLYQADKRGKPAKLPNPDIDALIASVQPQARSFEDQEIVDRMMVAMCLETARCLEDGIVETAVEADMGLVLGLGFPAFRGGALRYIDSMGVAKFCELADKYVDLGEMYRPTEAMRAKGAAAETYYA
jgi:3-hydroxyacyl-CoA dehydrogenase / enoyl-CoA hydratase / 3-hydroxybutyryl-CoA epimerase / enoyl-CoA isomerase